MIRSRRTTKNCNICHKEVAVKDFLRFRTVFGYVTLRRDCEYLFGHTIPDEVHICDRCWDEMQDVVRKTLGLTGWGPRKERQ